MTYALALEEANLLKTSLLDHGVKSVSVELQTGRASSGWISDSFVGTMGHHVVSTRASGNTPALALVKNGRADLPGPLYNGYGGFDEIARVLCLGWANHSGPGGPLAVEAGTIPTNNGRPYFFGWGFEGGLHQSDWPDSFHEFMARCLAGTLEWIGVTEASHVEHKTWAPTRKVDRLGYTLANARDAIAKEMEVVERSTTVDGGAGFLEAVFRKAVDVGVFSEYTVPGKVLITDELAAFLDRAGALQAKGARTWTKGQIAALVAASAAGGATSAEVIQEVIRRLGG